MAPDNCKDNEISTAPTYFHFIARGHVTEFQAPTKLLLRACTKVTLIHFGSLVLQEQRCIKSSEVTQQESQNIAASSVRLQTDTFSTEKVHCLRAVYFLFP
jgi:hypothetical protein